MSNKRALWADIAKFFTITLMVSGHLGLPHNLSIAVHMFHMPIFFILGGYSTIKRNTGSFLFFYSPASSLFLCHILLGASSLTLFTV